MLSSSGTTLASVISASHAVGLIATAGRIEIDYIFHIPSSSMFPCILHWMGNHYVVMYAAMAGLAYIADPMIGHFTVNKLQLSSLWSMVPGNVQKEGVVVCFRTRSSHSSLPYLTPEALL